MKNRLTTAVASLVIASLGTTAFAHRAQQTLPQQPTPQQRQMPPKQEMPPEQQMSPATSMHATSAKVQHEIRQALTRQGVTATGVHVMFSNGTARLSGTVFSRQDIAKAKHAAAQVQGVTQVDVSGLHARKH